MGTCFSKLFFHALLAEEKEKFDLEDVARGINEKLIRRHPHVFGDEDDHMKTADEVLQRWERIKAEEKKARGIKINESEVFKNLPPQLPALMYALDIYKRASKAKLADHGEWDEVTVCDHAEQLSEEKAGRMFFEWVGGLQKSWH